MSTLFDQFEESQVVITSRLNKRESYDDPYRTDLYSDLGGTRSSSKDEHGSDEQPIFKKAKTFNVSKLEDPISHVAVSDEKIVYVQGNQIFQYDQKKKSNTPVELPKKVSAQDEKIIKLFQDPTGLHIIVSTNAGDNYYLEGSVASKKPKQLTKLRQIFIESIAWNPFYASKDSADANTTHAILIGTNRGVLYETEIESQNEDMIRAFKKQVPWGGTIEKYIKELPFVIDKNEKVTGLLLQPLVSDKRRFFCIVTTPNRIFQFEGDISAESPVYAPLFNHTALAFHEIPGSLGHSNFCTWAPSAADVPSKFAWLTGAGIYFGNLDFSIRDAKSVTLDCKLKEYRQLVNRQAIETYPLYVCLTEFHCVLAFRDRLEAVSLLNMETVFQDNMQNKSFTIRGLYRDPVIGNLWLYSEKNFYKYVIQNEARDVWRCYLENEEYEIAKKYCQPGTTQMDKVNRAQADSLFKNNLYSEAAECYALTSISFEEVALKLIHSDQEEALKTFLIRKLQILGPEHFTQVTMLSCWLLELMLNRIAVLRDQLSTPYVLLGGTSQTGNDPVLNRDALEAELKTETAKFRSFIEMDTVRQTLETNSHTAYDLLLGHGDTDNLLYFATLMGDYDRVINHYLTQNEYNRALKLLREQKDKSLYYKYIPILMQRTPDETVKVLKDADSKVLDPTKLIPALVQCSKYWQDEHSEYVLEYLEYVVHKLKNKSTSIHNFLISLYCKLKKQDKLVTYLEQNDWNRNSIDYDPEYALRLCVEHKMRRASVIIYIILELYHEAVELALGVDIDLAKMAANLPENDKDLKKKLWMKIAQEMLKRPEDVSSAMENLEFGEFLKIEDVLPFFPDFQTIDHFKSVICDTLETYNREINDLKEEMYEATESAKNIRQDISQLRNRSGLISTIKRCDKCSFPVLSSAFFLFPCQHVFHSTCLQTEFFRIATPDLKRNLTALLERKQGVRGLESSNASDKSSQDSGIIQEKIDDMLAGDCVYCGDFMIESVDQTFYHLTSTDEIESWKL